MDPLSPVAPSRRREAARAVLRELVRTTRDVLPLIPAEEAFAARRLRSTLSRLEALVGADVDAEAFDDAFRDGLPHAPSTRSSVEDRAEARRSPTGMDAATLMRIVEDAEALPTALGLANALEGRLHETRDRQIGVHDALDAFERLRVSERRPVIAKENALDPAFLRQVVASLDGAGMRKAADTLIWTVWHADRARRRASAPLDGWAGGTDLALRAARDAMQGIRKAGTLEGALKLADAALATMDDVAKAPLAAE